jgi:hypothetical protein
MSSAKHVNKQINDDWLSVDAMQFFKSLSFDGYVLAGNSVTNMIQGITLQGDLDFWVSSADSYIRILHEFSQYDHYNLYPSMVELLSDNGLPRINLIFAQIPDPCKIIDRFDFDYCKCYYTPDAGIMATNECLKSINSKLIRLSNKGYNDFLLLDNIDNQVIRNRSINIMDKRILKAIGYGYMFTNDFWYHNQKLLKKFPNHPVKENYTEFPVKRTDLNLSAFEKTKPQIIITDITNIKKTLDQIYHQYEILLDLDNCELPSLLSFDKSQFNLLISYVECIVLLNPLSDAHYQREIRSTFASDSQRCANKPI